MTDTPEPRYGPERHVGKVTAPELLAPPQTGGYVGNEHALASSRRQLMPHLTWPAGGRGGAGGSESDSSWPGR